MARFARKMFVSQIAANSWARDKSEEIDSTVYVAQVGNRFEASGPNSVRGLITGIFHQGKLQNASPKREKNPVRRAGLKKGAKKYVNRPSQITGAAPSARLKKRRKAVADAPAGYFPNPTIYVSDYDPLAKHIFRTLKAHGKATPQIIANAIDEWMLASGRAYHEVRH